jgi:hypothetical protein
MPSKSYPVRENQFRDQHELLRFYKWPVHREVTSRNPATGEVNEKRPSYEWKVPLTDVAHAVFDAGCEKWPTGTGLYLDCTLRITASLKRGLSRYFFSACLRVCDVDEQGRVAFGDDMHDTPMGRRHRTQMMRFEHSGVSYADLKELLLHECFAPFAPSDKVVARWMLSPEDVEFVAHKTWLRVIGEHRTRASSADDARSFTHAERYRLLQQVAFRGYRHLSSCRLLPALDWRTNRRAIMKYNVTCRRRAWPTGRA